MEILNAGHKNTNQKVVDTALSSPWKLKLELGYKHFITMKCSTKPTLGMERNQALVLQER